jgi:hypothetical protein
MGLEEERTLFVPRVTRRMVQTQKSKPRPWGLFPLLGLAYICGVLAAHLWHPHLDFLTGGAKLGAALLSWWGLISWGLADPTWQEILAGQNPMTPETFAQWYYGLSVLGLICPVGLWQWWLSRPVSPKVQHAYLAEEHRRQQGQLTDKEAEAKLVFQGAGLPLASLEADPQKRNVKLVGLSVGRLEGHALVVGPTRSGKGMQLTQTALTYPHAMVIVDPKGEIYQRTAGFRETLGPVYKLPGHTLDLADYYNLRHRDDVAELHFHLLKPWADNQPIFADKCKSLFTAVGRFAHQHKLNPIQTLLEAADNDPAVVLKALQTVDPDSVLAFTNGREPDEMDRMAASAWGTFATRMYEYVAHIPTVTQGNSTTSIPTHWAEQNATIYITYPFDQLKGVGGIVSAIVAALLRKQIQREKKTPAVIAVDELPVVGLRNVTEYLATVGGYGLTLVLYVQTYSQLADIYGERGAETILSNCQHQVWYPPADEVTARRMEVLGGTKIVPSLSVSEAEERKVGNGRSVSEQVQKVPVLAASEVMALGREEVLLRVDRQWVLRGRRLWPVPQLAGLPQLEWVVSCTTRPKRIVWGKFVEGVGEVEPPVSGRQFRG